jgi:hypothetical protein
MSDILLKLRNNEGICIVTPDIMNYIKLFTGELVEKNGKYTRIKKIPKTDCRYEMLRKRPRIRQIHNRDLNHNYPLKGSVWFKVNGKFMVINVGYQPVWIGNRIQYGDFVKVHYNSITNIRQIL